MVTYDASVLAGLQRGDSVRAVGTIGQYQGMELLELDTIARFGSGAVPTPRAVTAKDLFGEQYAGQLVLIVGRISVTSDLEVSDESGEVLLYLRNKFFTDARFAGGLTDRRRVEVVGIAEQYDSRPPFTSGYRLLPRDGGDIRLAPKPPNPLAMALAAALLLTLFSSLWIWRANSERRAALAETLLSQRERTERALRDSRDELRDLGTRLRSIREEESTRIAREIHDQLGQMLTAMRMDLSWITGRASGGDPLTEERMHSMTRLLASGIEAVRQIATDLRPPVLDDLGLVAAVEWHVQEFAERAGLQHELHIEVDEVTLDGDHATSVFRILQEALTNVARHAEANRVIVSLGTSDEGLDLTVEDDGTGITEDAAKNGASLGLLGMRERANALEGQLTVGPGEQCGTVVTLTMPLSN